MFYIVVWCWFYSSKAPKGSKKRETKIFNHRQPPFCTDVRNGLSFNWVGKTRFAERSVGHACWIKCTFHFFYKTTKSVSKFEGKELNISGCINLITRNFYKIYIVMSSKNRGWTHMQHTFTG